MSKRKPIRTDIAWSTHSTITVKGFDLCNDILGTVSLGDIAFLELTDRLPAKRESVVFNAIAVTLVEHGLTPSAIATRMTYAGAPEAMQAAVAAGLCGLGNVFVGSMETVWNGRVTPPHNHEAGAYTPMSPVVLMRGRELGRFNMGSTVILLAPPGMLTWKAMARDTPVRMGQSLGTLAKIR